MANCYVVYILKCSDSTLYTGITNDLKRRLQQHLLGKASKYTRCRLPVQLVYIEGEYTKGQALTRELAIKKLNRQQKMDLIANAELIPF
ncbi:Excinuclease ABC, C subunit domain protein [Desulforamulus reducens MI-1]|uniref:Excinuclease ABC, C subunit domain protein n=1 Tax=Desulforamulus reducens (strain ATCC BAA-1160 / DSM 100696 / MI-1) TaxID=349161 RepID=A4J4G2_DESRM|nr:GIY-YIG nuclease family protein [Desulforamulus reducens]ABO49965.1 Excinuclease ABC, C subunit domain protein [Desulforamulus reducens MI-1]